MTDDALLMERMGVPVHIVEGAEENIKITTPRDLELARFLIGTCL
jgi:2-C-methyl-D-erythritol 4-phosphate cytidylyltransferase